MAVIINGENNPQTQPTRVSFDPVRGLVVHPSYTAVGNGAIGVFNQLMNAGIACEMDINGRHSTVSATVTSGQGGFPDVSQDHYQLMANEVQEDIKLLPGFVALGDTEIDKILTQVDSKIADRTYVADFTGISGLGQEYYFVMTHGQTHFMIGQPVFHWTTYVSFNSTSYRNDGGRELIYSTSQLLDLANPPAGIASEMTSYSAPFIPSNFVWGWRHLPSTRTTQAGNRIEIATEFVLALYPTCVYSPA